VQPAPGADLDPELLAAELRRVLAGYKVPRTFTLAASLPRDDNGKIAKRGLREEFASERRDAGERARLER
jgi:long-chain acyl-CoA synthetase